MDGDLAREIQEGLWLPGLKLVNWTFGKNKGQTNKQNIASPNSTAIFYFVISYLFLAASNVKDPAGIT